jgi:HK97 family phage major capsid protein
MTERINSEELLDLVKQNHAATLENYQKAEKALLEIPELKGQLQNLEQRMSRRGGGGDPSDSENKSWGQQIVDSDEFKSFLTGGGRVPARLEVKAVGTINSGSTLAGPLIVPDVRTDAAVLPQRRFTIRDLLAPGQTDGNTIYFPKMTARYANAAMVAESAAKPLSGFDLIQATAPVRTIAHFMQLTRQSLDDAPALRSLVDSELRYGLKLTEEGQLIAGDGTGQNVSGLIPQGTAYSAPFAVTGETFIDRIALAMLQAELALLPASGIVVNPTDWTKAKMLKDATGRYILGPPTATGPQFLWGLPVVPTPAIPVNNFLVGAFDSAAQIFDRMDVEILLSTEHGSNFTNNEVTVRCEERLALAVKRPAALITGTLP